MVRPPPRSTRTYTLFPYTTLFRAERVVLIGHLFPKHAEQLGCLTSSRSDASVFQQLLDDFRGDYVVIDATGDASQPLRILRSPSGGVACVHAIGNGHGFVTSDISIPVSLGLCERYVEGDYRTEARRVGDVCVSTVRYRCAP